MQSRCSSGSGTWKVSRPCLSHREPNGAKRVFLRPSASRWSETPLHAGDPPALGCAERDESGDHEAGQGAPGIERPDGYLAEVDGHNLLAPSIESLGELEERAEHPVHSRHDDMVALAEVEREPLASLALGQGQAAREGVVEEDLIQSPADAVTIGRDDLRLIFGALDLLAGRGPGVAVGPARDGRQISGLLRRDRRRHRDLLSIVPGRIPGPHRSGDTLDTDIDNDSARVGSSLQELFVDPDACKARRRGRTGDDPI